MLNPSSQLRLNVLVDGHADCLEKERDAVENARDKVFLH